MQAFIHTHAKNVIGTLSGHDRMIFRGTARRLANVEGLSSYMNYQGVLLKDFSSFVERTTTRIRAASEAVGDGDVIYVRSSATSKEEIARNVVEKNKIKTGPICVISCVEPCKSFDVRRNRERKRLELVACERKCLYLYHYVMHPRFGFMHVRLQTWFPFNMQIALNGREWLARQMDRARMGYERRDNCFTHLSNVDRAQKLMDEQLQVSWPDLCDTLARQFNPAFAEALPENDYYWSLYQSEWATDVMFRSAAELDELYPSFLRHGMTTFGSDDIMRFLGFSARAYHSPHFERDVVTDIKRRPEGVRIKHCSGANSIKLYNKQGSVLRVETTINKPRDFKVFRPKEGDEKGKKSWRPLRKGVADLHRRAELCQAANERYLDALAAIDHSQPFGDMIDDICKRKTWKGERVRALNPFAKPDAELVAAISDAAFTLTGMRNREICAVLFPKTKTDDDVKRARATTTRKMRLLRAHGLLAKVPKTHRYQLTDKARRLIVAIRAAASANTRKLTQNAA